MTHPRPVPSIRLDAQPDPVDEPPAEVVAFIRFCHERRSVGWPELYDEMCAVAARREFRGWGHEDFAARGITFALGEMPRLAGWVRTFIALRTEAMAATSAPAGREADRQLLVVGPMPQPAGA